jgi:signal transduction histidine kinase/ActR/RegA family two-component response regulator
MHRSGWRIGGLRMRFVMVVVVVCGALWLSALFDVLRDRAVALDTAERQHDNIAGALAEQAARSLQAADLILQQAALLDPARPGAGVDEAGAAELLRRYESGVPQVKDLFLFDPARHLHLSTAAIGTAFPDLSDRSYFTSQRDAPGLGLFVSEPFVSRTNGIPTFVLSRRLGDAQFRGIVGAAVAIAYFRRFYQALELGSGSTVELLRADGVALVNRDREHVESSPAPSPWLVAIGMLGASDAAHTTVEDPALGRTRISLRRVAGYPAVVVVGRGESEILGPWRHEAWKNVARTLVITALAAILLVALLRQLARDERISAQLHQSSKLEALGTLAGGIAHDFNNILGAVLGYGELAVQHTAPGSQQRRYVDNIVIAANRARDLVARILAFSRPGVGTRVAVVLQDIVSEISSLMCGSIPSQVTLDVRLAPEPLVVMGDAAQLHQMIGNLLANAVQALPGSGRVVVAAEPFEIETARELTVGRLRPGRYARLRVADSGRGIAAEQVERIFDPFFTTKAVGQGTGLGLSLVHGIVLDHEAAIEVESRVSHGTTFSVYLPLADVEPGRESTPLQAPLGDGQRILVVDDEEALVRLAEEVLASLGYEPVGCVGAREALQVFGAAPDGFDALLSDVIMPEMSGPDLAIELRRLRPTLPVILMSGFGGPGLQTRAQGAGAQATLLKPLRAVDLGRCLADLFGPATGIVTPAAPRSSRQW